MGDKNIELGELSDEDLEDMMGMDEDDEGPTSYVKFKTPNELLPEEIEKIGPKFEQKQLDDLDQVKPFGSVVQFIPEGQGVLLVMPHDFNSIFDLDNIVCLSNNENNKELSKYVVGFISDLVGPVQMPLYSVALYKSFTDQLKDTLQDQDIGEFMKNREICLV